MEIVCPSCQHRFSIAGSEDVQSVTCPACSAMVASGDQLRDQSSPLNPYETPAPGDDESPVVGRELGGPTGLVHHRIESLDVLSVSWALFKYEAPMLVLAMVVMHVIILAFAIVFLGGTLLVTSMISLDGPALIAILTASVLGMVVLMVLQIYLQIGLFRMQLAIARDVPRRVSMLFSARWEMLPVLAAWFLLMLVILAARGFEYAIHFTQPMSWALAASAACLLLDLTITLTFWSFPLFIVDQRCGAIESLKLSWKFASGNRLAILMLGFLIGGFLVLTVFTLFLGLLVVIPLSQMVLTVAYLKMTGQPIPALRHHA